MPIRIVKTPIQVFREGKFVELAVGSESNFTDAELADIKKVNPDAIAHPLSEDVVKPAVVPSKTA